MNPQFSPPQQVIEVLCQLAEQGHEGWLVGGCVRDLVLGHVPSDWDICTSATPETVCNLFPKSLHTGILHGTVTVLMEGVPPADSANTTKRKHFPVEVTTWRSDGVYSDHRRPDAVHFSDSLEEDLGRRDFTINAMAWNPIKGLVDLHDGLADLSSQLIRCVGDPHQRFHEDALRMLRAIRFCSQLGFSLDTLSAAAIISHRELLKYVSQERIEHEMTRTLTGMHPSRAGLWWDLGMQDTLFLSMARELHHPCPLIHHWEQGKTDIPYSPAFTDEPSLEVLMWTVFFVACGLNEPSSTLSDWMRVLRFPRSRISGIERLMKLAGPDGITGQPLPQTPRNIRELNQRHGEGWVRSSRNILYKLFQLPETAWPTAVDIGPLPTGKQLLTTLPPDRIPEGPAFGALLECLHLALYERPELNTPEYASLLLHNMSNAFPANQ